MVPGFPCNFFSCFEAVFPALERIVGSSDLTREIRS